MSILNNRAFYINIILYNYINSFLFVFAGGISTWQFFVEMQTNLQIICFTLLAFLSCFLYYIFIIKKIVFGKLLFVFTIDTILFVVFTLFNFVFYNSCKSFFPVVALNSAYGLWIMMLFGIYFIVSFVLKIIIAVLSVVKSK